MYLFLGTKNFSRAKVQELVVGSISHVFSRAPRGTVCGIYRMIGPSVSEGLSHYSPSPPSGSWQSFLLGSPSSHPNCCWAKYSPTLITQSGFSICLPANVTAHGEKRLGLKPSCSPRALYRTCLAQSRNSMSV